MQCSCKCTRHNFVEIQELIIAQFCNNARVCCSSSLQTSACSPSIHFLPGFYSTEGSIWPFVCIDSRKREGEAGTGNVSKRPLVSIKPNILHSALRSNSSSRPIASCFQVCMHRGHTVTLIRVCTSWEKMLILWIACLLSLLGSVFDVAAYTFKSLFPGFQFSPSWRCLCAGGRVADVGVSIASHYLPWPLGSSQDVLQERTLSFGQSTPSALLQSPGYISLHPGL